MHISSSTVRYYYILNKQLKLNKSNITNHLLIHLPDSSPKGIVVDLILDVLVEQLSGPLILLVVKLSLIVGQIVLNVLQKQSSKVLVADSLAIGVAAPFATSAALAKHRLRRR